MAFAYSGIVVAIAIIFITLALDEISEKETVATKTINLTEDLPHITIPSFEEWCKQNYDVTVIPSELNEPTTETIETSESMTPVTHNIPDPEPVSETIHETDTATETETTTIETDFLSLLTSYGIVKTRANILINTFGENLLIIAKEGGVKELTKVKGIGDATAAKVVALANTN